MPYVYIIGEHGENVTNRQFVIDGITYPSNYCINASDEELSNLGIIKLLQVYPELPGPNYYYTGEYTDDYGDNTRTYSYAVNPAYFPTSGSGTDFVVIEVPEGIWITNIAIKSANPGQLVNLGITNGGTQLVYHLPVSDTAFTTTNINYYFDGTSSLYIWNIDGDFDYKILYQRD